MKTRIILTCMLTLILPRIFSQYDLDGNFDLNFDDNYVLNHLTIDTISNPNNIWQVAAPQKGEFIHAFSVPNVIITDSVNSYPVNDTSSFIITNVALGEGFDNQHTVILEGQYFVDSDSLQDYGKIEFSPDNGATWVDLFHDTVPVSEWYWLFDKPVLTGKSNGWKSFGLNLAPLGAVFDINHGDTV
ncbi:MAG: hypothetical protein JXB49_31275 [Bacteroidales bacterium]|nr:hypothetical protein [Bacteroidales bacterium]